MDLFAVLRIEKGQNGGLLSRAVHRIKRRKLTVQPTDTPLGSYLLLTAYSERINWDKVEAVCGRAAHALVLPPGLEPPEGGLAARFEPDALRAQLICNACLEIIHRCRVPLYRKVVTLVDRQAYFTDLIPDLLCQCITVRVVTEREAEYRRVSERMMEELGASLLVSNHMEGAGGSLLVLCPDGDGAERLATTVPVLTGGGIDRPSPCRLVGDPRIKPTGELAGIVPAGIDPLDFAGAFYQFGRWKAAGQLRVDTLRCKGNQLKPGDIARFIEQSNPQRAAVLPIK